MIHQLDLNYQEILKSAQILIFDCFFLKGVLHSESLIKKGFDLDWPTTMLSYKINMVHRRLDFL